MTVYFDSPHGYANDEISLLTEQLIAAWGRLAIHCDGAGCVVADRDAYVRNFNSYRQYHAPTLLEALRKAADGLTVGQ